MTDQPKEHGDQSESKDASGPQPTTGHQDESGGAFTGIGATYFIVRGLVNVDEGFRRYRSKKRVAAIREKSRNGAQTEEP